MTYRLSLLLIIFFPFLGTPPARAQYVESNKILTAGKSVTIAAKDSKELTIIYRPGSNISQTQTIELSGTNYQWTPDKAGIFALSTPGQPSQTVSVSFGHFPLAGLIVFIVAGSILFGGAIYAAINLFGDSSAKAI